jgi:hypothetical protein
MNTSNKVPAPATSQRTDAFGSDRPTSGGEGKKCAGPETSFTGGSSAKKRESDGKSPQDACESDRPTSGGEGRKCVEAETSFTGGSSAKKRKSDETSPRDALVGCSAGASDDAVLCPDQIKEQQNKKQRSGWHRDSFFVPGERNEGVPFQTFKGAFSRMRTETGHVSTEVHAYNGAFFIYLGQDIQGNMLWHFPGNEEKIFVFHLQDIIETRAYMPPESIAERLRQLKKCIRLKGYDTNIVNDFYMESTQKSYSDGFLLTTALERDARVYLLP